ncbi:hypothetical protein PF005_g16214 [Phytophthora fragariae]|uniref:Uncharacterized protein n=1 Tax=Phytophthora fragariae TaxID=53985 RepID=A0A6A3RFB9_9STRA|nr:hypothetical protein PF009_g18295 [Phytophthora fragariae]KAE8995692.1 hypothetical protein PF011_g16216 [Phytophthora fragariae]KAE9095929.1 hypothetical protein PF007_g17202 [Phytophthora fragariae]KAE9198235.1 hypothetical protein PF005_g16214 [Phytophthora fragariae]KAE9200836.1 hypothetical protein PF004_g18887 [Phytophthora fragariae]
MIEPFDPVDARKRPQPQDQWFKIVAWDDDLPAFDPLVMVKTVVLSPSSVKKFNQLALKFARVTEQSVICAIMLRSATFALPAELGRKVAPIAALLHLPGMIVFTAGFRTEYVKIILHTFDFWFLHATNTIWAVVFSIVLGDVRALLVVVCWGNFTNALLQETYLRNTNFIMMIMVLELVYYILLLLWLSLEFVDGLHHYTVTTARGQTLSTKDILVNVLGTLTMLLVQNLYRRFAHARRQYNDPGTLMQALGYRCKIALGTAEPSTPSIAPSRHREQQRRGIHVDTATLVAVLNQRSKLPPLKMRLTTESVRFDPRRTVWPRIGTLRPLSTWEFAVIYSSGTMGALFAVLPLFLPRNNDASGVIAVLGLVMTLLFSGIFVCCYQRQLLRRIALSFHFIFFATQILATGFCVIEIFSWEWAPSCAVASLLLLVFTILTVDALTPTMKRRLHFKFWMPVVGIILFWMVEVVLLVDALVMGNWDLQDRVFLELIIFGRQAQFRVVSFFLSRILTIFVWSARYVNIALSRQNDNVLILLRGEVEFDYEGWKRQSRLGPGAKQTRQFCT